MKSSDYAVGQHPFQRSRSRTGAWSETQSGEVLMDAVSRSEAQRTSKRQIQQEAEDPVLETDDSFDIYRSHVSSGHLSAKPSRRCCSQCLKFAQKLVIYESNPWRKAWSIILFVLLVYTGTLFPYRLCFLEFKIPDGTEISRDWVNFEIVVDILFWFDLVINFFFTWTDAFGNEKDDIVNIVVHYLCGYFALNLIACLPEEAVEPIFGAIAKAGDSGESGNQSTVHKITRISRLQRTTRLARLARLVRLTRILRLVRFVTNTRTFKWLQEMRGMRVVNFVIFLFWIVHILACGWYLCAALHFDMYQTWVARRAVDVDGTSLLERGPAEAWAHSCYFVFTVFTTVGFGDMSAMTMGEIAYVCFTMLVGAVVHSFIVSSMINILTFLDATQVEMQKHREVVEGFTKHTHLDPQTHHSLKQWIEHLVQEGMLAHQYDREVMREILTGGHLPHSLLNVLPERVYQGRLIRNKFIVTCLSHSREVPPRLTILIALALVNRVYVKDEVVYSMHDHPFNLYLIQSGIFAFVAAPGPHGGKDESPLVEEQNGFASVYAARMIATNRLSQMRSSRSSATVSKKPIVLSDSKTMESDVFQPCEEGAENKLANEGPKLYPYQLLCPGGYFGDLELLDAGARRCTARCEGRTCAFKTIHCPQARDHASRREVVYDENGRATPEYGDECSLLLLHKQDFIRLIEEFPHCRNAWWYNARHHEVLRMERRQRLTVGRDYLGAAASVMQRIFRARRDSKGVKSMHLQAKVKLKPIEPGQGHARKSIVAKKAQTTGLHVLRESMQSELRAGLQELRLELRSSISEIREGLEQRDRNQLQPRAGRTLTQQERPETPSVVDVNTPERASSPADVAHADADTALAPERAAADQDELLRLREEVVRLRYDLAEERRLHQATLQDHSDLRWLASQVEPVNATAPTTDAPVMEVEVGPLDQLPSDTEEC